MQCSSIALWSWVCIGSAAAATGNLRSNAVLIKAGFKLEGLKRDGAWLYDHFVDHNLYGLLETDWQARKIGS
jgi:ribosomal-protein-serine acetyltransferase